MWMELSVGPFSLDKVLDGRRGQLTCDPCHQGVAWVIRGQLHTPAPEYQLI